MIYAYTVGTGLDFSLIGNRKCIVRRGTYGITARFFHTELSTGIGTERELERWNRNWRQVRSGIMQRLATLGKFQALREPLGGGRVRFGPF